jgi:biotin transport system substrate-specific component
MIYVLNPEWAQKGLIRLLGIVGFVALTAIGAQISIPREPVPVTLQVLAALLAGLTLGPRDGFASQFLYVAGIAAGLPIAANGMGAQALAGPTAGYIYAFPIAAWIVGMLAIRKNVVVRWLASVVAVIVIYIIGATFLKSELNLSWQATWDNGVEPFIVIDMVKALVAATSGELLRGWWTRQYPGAG